MNKRGQFYIIIVLLLSLAIFGLVAKPNKLEETAILGDFDSLSQNYLIESPKITNYVLYNEGNVSETLTNFTQDFIDYAKNINPSIGLIYLYHDQEEDIIYVKNFLHEEVQILIGNSSQELFGSQQQTINDISLLIGGKKFVHSVPIPIENYEEGYGGFTGSGIESGDFVRLNIGGIFYNFRTPQTTDLVIVLKSTQGNTTEINIYGQG